MESPLAKDRVIKAQEDSTSESPTGAASTSQKESRADRQANFCELEEQETSVDMGQRLGHQCRPDERHQLNEKNEATALDSVEDEPESRDRSKNLETSVERDREDSRQEHENDSSQDLTRNPDLGKSENVVVDSDDANAETGGKSASKDSELPSGRREDDCAEKIRAQRERTASQSSEKSLLDENPVGKDERDCFTPNVLIPFRKRPASDFLPIGATEVKRIGIEISEEEANQLRNEVRRLSPVLVSLRERTLGEISLSSDSAIFSDNSARSYCSREVIFYDRSHVIREGSASEDVESPRRANASTDDQPEGRKSCVSSTREDVDNSELDGGRVKEPETIVNEANEADQISRQNVTAGNFKSEKIPDDPTPCAVDRPLPGNLSYGSNVIVDGRKVDKEFSRCDSARSKFPEEKEMKAEGKALSATLGETKLSKAVIEKLEENVEVVLTESSATSSSSLSPSSFSEGEEEEEVGEREEGEDVEDKDRFKASKSSKLTSTSSEVVPGSSGGVAEAITPEENDTSMTRAMSRRCEETLAKGALCQDNDSQGSEAISAEVTSRLSIARPETFTEDSAESLTLAASGRDEVRSDGSDSGLGSEIPGEAGQSAAPESDSETSFLDRIPDDILSVKEKGAMQLEETFAPSCANISAHPRVLHADLPSPPKSNLKRRLNDCTDNGPDAKRTNNCDTVKKKRSIHFDAVTVYYFPRAQGFTCVPSQGGSTLGMSAMHTHAERFSLSEHAAEQRRIHRARLAQLRSERAANCVIEGASSSEDPSDDTDEEPSDNEEVDIDSYYFLQPVPTWQRRALLRAAGVRRIDTLEKDECRDIRASREHCGCSCKGYCDPESCPCSRANVKCQVDRAGFPCGCTRDGCANSSGRIEFNPVRVRTHFIHTLMRLELEKKQCEEEGLERGERADGQAEKSSLREMGLGSVMDKELSADNRNSGGGFTTLHYNSGERDSSGVSGVNGVGMAVGLSNCQSEIPGTREDSLDLYAIRDDCYPSEDTVDGSQQCQQRKLHAEFGQGFQIQANHSASFQQNAYHDYQSYASQPSTSRVQQSQFQAIPGNQGFSPYAYAQDNGAMVQGSCQIQHPAQHASSFESSFSHDGGASSQYTNLNPVSSVNSVVQQIGKLEPFSELLSGRYSYYGDVEPQTHATYHPGTIKSTAEHEKIQENGQPSDAAEECDENFGEIIKKSMVETVSA